VFDISHNFIEELDDLIDMGGLGDLHILDLSGNFVVTYITRINMIEMLLCPKKYVKYNPGIKYIVFA
jgi:thiamine pyrophosphokinase